MSCCHAVLPAERGWGVFPGTLQRCHLQACLNNQCCGATESQWPYHTLRGCVLPACSSEVTSANILWRCITACNVGMGL